jgi:hypothetical protein
MVRGLFTEKQFGPRWNAAYQCGSRTHSSPVPGAHRAPLPPSSRPVKAVTAVTQVRHFSDDRRDVILPRSSDGCFFVSTRSRRCLILDSPHRKSPWDRCLRSPTRIALCTPSKDFSH